MLESLEKNSCEEFW
ncbi:hypothetical protein RSAG8_07381, partial [Rhizoctonia solani AG-8 WAC10335]